MNTNILVAGALLLSATTIPAARAAEAALPPVQVVEPVSIGKSCRIAGSRYLHSLEVARALGRERSAETDRLRDDANHAARQLCLQGYSDVEFTFARGTDQRPMAIVIDRAPSGPADPRRVR